MIPLSRHGRRGGATLLEVVVAVALGMATLGFVLGAFRFFGMKTAAGTAESAQVRAQAFLVERLRRLMRFGALQVVPVEGGFQVAVWNGLHGDGAGVEVHTFRVVPDQPGVVEVLDGSGRRSRYEVGDAGLGLDVSAEERILRVQVDEDGSRVVETRVHVPPRVPGPLLLRPGEDALDLERLRGALRGAEGGFAESVPLGEVGPPVLAAAEGREWAPGDAARGADGSGPSRSGLDDEIDVLGIELSPLGRLFLPPSPPWGLPATDDGVVAARLRDGGWARGRPRGWPAWCAPGRTPSGPGTGGPRRRRSTPWPGSPSWTA